MVWPLRGACLPGNSARCACCLWQRQVLMHTAMCGCICNLLQAKLTDVVVYLRGNKHLVIPDSWYDTVNTAVLQLLVARP